MYKYICIVRGLLLNGDVLKKYHGLVYNSSLLFYFILLSRILYTFHMKVYNSIITHIIYVYVICVYILYMCKCITSLIVIGTICKVFMLIDRVVSGSIPKIYM